MRFALVSVVARVGIADLQAIATACEPALAAVAAAWSPVYGEIVSPPVQVVYAVSDLTDGDVPVVFVGALPPDDAADLAFHSIRADEAGAARPYALILVDEYQPIPSVQQAAWHEMAETLVDPRCERYDDAGWAIEVCDPVQSDDLDVGGVNLSPFVLPAWFGLGATGATHVDSAGLLSTPHTVHAGGYAMKQDGSEVTGDGYRHPPSKLSRHSRRMKRRGAIERLAAGRARTAEPAS